MAESDRLLIVGAGSAGMCCAIAAAEAGAHPTVIEQGDAVGGTLAVGGKSLSAAGTRRQRQRGIIDSAELHLADVARIGRGRADVAVVARAVAEASATVDWLEDLGYVFADDAPTFPFQNERYTVARTYTEASTRADVVYALVVRRWQELVDAGAITLLLGHRLESLIREDSRISGVDVQTAAGHRQLSATQIVLATGGYGGSRGALLELTPEVDAMVSLCPPSSTGAALFAAREAGAMIRNTDLLLPFPGFFEDETTPGRALPGSVLFADRRHPSEIFVTQSGARFVREDDPSIPSLDRAIRDVGDVFWLVFDEAALASGPTFHSHWHADDIRGRARAGAHVWCADDIPTLAQRAGIDPAGLAQAASDWNAAVASGNDPFGRNPPTPALETPPFYAARSISGVIASPGGIAVSAELEVLDADNEPIAGLYAIGEILGSGATMGAGKCSAMMLTPALSLGRVLGRTLASRLRVKA